jgi:hypothetical protein
VKRRKRNFVPLSDADRVHLIPDKLLLEEVCRRFSGEGRTAAVFARMQSESGSDTYFLESSDTPVSRLIRLWWQLFDSKVERNGDSIHIFEDGEWIDYTAGEDIDKEAPNDRQE